MVQATSVSQCNVNDNGFTGKKDLEIYINRSWRVGLDFYIVNQYNKPGLQLGNA